MEEIKKEILDLRERRQDDHDILIEVRTLQKEMYTDLKELKDGTSDRIKALERDKADKEEFYKHDVRIASLEKTKVEKLSEFDQYKDTSDTHAIKIAKLQQYFWVGVGIVLAANLFLVLYFKA